MSGRGEAIAALKRPRHNEGRPIPDCRNGGSHRNGPSFRTEFYTISNWLSPHLTYLTYLTYLTHPTYLIFASRSFACAMFWPSGGARAMYFSRSGFASAVFCACRLA